MALRDQPYIPLYIQDYLTDEKLNSCSWATQGIYIKILCVLHKQDIYGKILFKQIDKQNDSKVLNFALILIKQIPCRESEMIDALTELIENKVLRIDENYLYQKRMVKDGEISEQRSLSAKKGGGNPKLKAKIDKNLFKQNDKQIDKQNPEYENEYESVNENVNVNENEHFNFLENLKNSENSKNLEKIKKLKIDVLPFFYAELVEFVNAVNGVMKTRYVPNETLYKNFEYWHGVHGIDKMLEAVANIPNSQFWSQAATPEKLLRRRNQNGECDNIQTLLNSKNQTKIAQHGTQVTNAAISYLEKVMNE